MGAVVDGSVGKCLWGKKRRSGLGAAGVVSAMIDGSSLFSIRTVRK